MEQEINPQQFSQPQQKINNSFLIVIISIFITAFAVGGLVYWLQEAKFNKEITGLKQTIAKLNEQITSLGGVPKPDGTTNGGQSTKEKISGDYQWDDQSLRIQYSNASWDKIATYKLAGFSPNTALTEKRTEGCGGRYNGSYLRVEGGMCGVGYWLEKTNGEKLNSLEKLVSNFAPIENEAEAVSFAAVTNGDLKIDESGIPEGHVLAISGGFLVQLVYNNTFGCGSHKPTGVIFKVTNDGNIQIIASEKQKPPLPGEPVMCVD